MSYMCKLYTDKKKRAINIFQSHYLGNLKLQVKNTLSKCTKANDQDLNPYFALLQKTNLDYSTFH